MKMILEMLPAALGTVAFAILYNIPKKYYPYCAFVGAAGWLLYRVLTELAGMGTFESTLLATALVVILSRFVAVANHCPATVFVTAGIFPLVPGAGIYWACYYAVAIQFDQAGTYALSALQAIIGIVLGIVVVFELPYSVFSLKRKKKASL